MSSVHVNRSNRSPQTTLPQPAHIHTKWYIFLFPELTGIQHVFVICIWIRSKKDSAPNSPVWPFMVNIVCTTSIYFLIILICNFPFTNYNHSKHKRCLRCGIKATEDLKHSISYFEVPVSVFAKLKHKTDFEIWILYWKFV